MGYSKALDSRVPLQHVFLSAPSGKVPSPNARHIKSRCTFQMLVSTPGAVVTWWVSGWHAMQMHGRRGLARLTSLLARLATTEPFRVAMGLASELDR